MNKPSERKNRGFTLIELMSVAAILGILAAVALPKFGDAILRAQEAAQLAYLGNLRGALTVY